MLKINVLPDGLVESIWNDALAPLVEEGSAVIQRASHVEPTADGKWTADLAPVGGPVLGPFTLRAEALSAEHVWLENAGY